MTIPKQKFREIILLLLYSYDLSLSQEEDIESLVMETLRVSRRSVKEAFAKMLQVLEKKELLDAKIKEISKSYELSRIQKLEKNILRLGLYEMFFDETLPKKVAIHEAMRLAKKFSTKEAAFFVNALLDAAYKQLQGETCNIEALEESSLLLIKSEEISKECALNDQSEIIHEA